MDPQTKRRRLELAQEPADKVPTTLLEASALLEQLMEDGGGGADSVLQHVLGMCPDEGVALGIRRLEVELPAGAFTPGTPTEARTGVNILGPAWFPKLGLEVGASALHVWRAARFLLLRGDCLEALEEHLVQRAVRTHLAAFAAQLARQGSGAPADLLPQGVADALGELPGTVASESLALALQSRWQRLLADVRAAQEHAEASDSDGELRRALKLIGGGAPAPPGGLALLRDGGATDVGSSLRALHAPVLKMWLGAASACGHTVDTGLLLAALGKRGIKLGVSEVMAALNAGQAGTFAQVCDAVLPSISAKEHVDLQRHIMRCDSVPLLRAYSKRAIAPLVTASVAQTHPTTWAHLHIVALTCGATRVLKHLWLQHPELQPRPEGLPALLTTAFSVDNMRLKQTVQCLMDRCGTDALERASASQRAALLDRAARISTNRGGRTVVTALLAAGCVPTKEACEGAASRGNVPVLGALWLADCAAPGGASPALWQATLRSGARGGQWPVLKFVYESAAGLPALLTQLPARDALAALLQQALSGSPLRPVAEVALVLADSLLRPTPGGP